MRAVDVVFTDFNKAGFSMSPVSGRDAVTTAPWTVSWYYGYKRRTMTVPADYRFGMATDHVAGWWMRLLRFLLNPAHSWRAAALHDPLYSSQGGRRPLKTCTLLEFSLPFSDVTREEADAVHDAASIADGAAVWECRLSGLGLRLLGKAAWND